MCGGRAVCAAIHIRLVLSASFAKGRGALTSVLSGVCVNAPWLGNVGWPSGFSSSFADDGVDRRAP